MKNNLSSKFVVSISCSLFFKFYHATEKCHKKIKKKINIENVELVNHCWKQAYKSSTYDFASAVICSFLRTIAMLHG